MFHNAAAIPSNSFDAAAEPIGLEPMVVKLERLNFFTKEKNLYQVRLLA